MSNRERQGGAGYRVAIVGAGTLKGKEVGELLPDTAFPATDIKLLDDEETLGALESVGDEMTFIQSVTAENFGNADIVFFASDAGFTRQAWPLAIQAGSAVVDMSYALEGEPGSTVRSSWIDRELNEAPALDLQPGPVVVAHPAAVVLALLLLRVEKIAANSNAVVTIFEPASERGKKGLDELHGQTVNLLSFQQLPTDVYDVQVAFNMVSRFGEKTEPTLESTERRLAEHFRKITRDRLAVPSMMLLNAPIFHGYAFSLYIETEHPVAVGDMAQGLAGDHVEVTRTAEEAPTTVGAAGQENILVSVKRDAQKPNGLWIWATADNLRVLALNAIGAAEQLMASRPRGKVQ